MTSIGGLVLDDHLQLTGLLTSRDVAASTVVTLGGLSRTTTVPLSGGRTFSLSADRVGDTVKGLFSRSQIIALKALAGTGVPAELVHPQGTFTVLVLSTADIQPVFDCVDPEPDAWYSGSILLQEV